MLGLAWNGNTTLYATGGTDDNVHVYTRASAAPFGAILDAGAIALVTARASALALLRTPTPGGLRDGKILIVANDFNDSISVIDTASKQVIAEYDLRPYNTSGQDGVAGGEFPWAVALKATASLHLVGRDRESWRSICPRRLRRNSSRALKLAGNAYGMAFSPDQSKLFVAEENSDQVSVIDTASIQSSEIDRARAPDGVLVGGGRDEQVQRDGTSGTGRYTGVSPVATTVSPDGKTLYVVNNAANSIAVVPLQGNPPTRRWR